MELTLSPYISITSNFLRLTPNFWRLTPKHYVSVSKKIGFRLNEGEKYYRLN